MSALFVACAAGPELEAPHPPPAPVPLAAPEPPRAPPGKLYREDVMAQLDAGLGDFLQKVEVEPRLEQGSFVGWTILGLYPEDAWQGVDLAPGDVVTRVNGRPIERETDAFDAFQATRGASFLSVSFLRGGEARTLELQIVPRPKAGEAGIAAR